MGALHHINDADLTRLQLGSMTGLELYIVEEHLLWCPYRLGDGTSYCTNRAGCTLSNIQDKGAVPNAPHFDG